MIALRFALSDPQKAQERAQLHPAHKAHLVSAPFKVTVSGPAFDERGDTTVAALLTAEVDNLGELERFSADDPFVRSGVYSQVWIFEWRPSQQSVLSVLPQA